MKRLAVLPVVVLFFICSCLPAQAAENPCARAAGAINAKLSPGIDEAELSDILNRLNQTGNKKLPDKFVTKARARAAGWKPGRDLWSVPTLSGSSIGGDKFGNFEGRLPRGKWREADLDYKGGRRGAKRLIFSPDGKRYVSVDHYRTFMEVPACR